MNFLKILEKYFSNILELLYFKNLRKKGFPFEGEASAVKQKITQTIFSIERNSNETVNPRRRMIFVPMVFQSHDLGELNNNNNFYFIGKTRIIQFVYRRQEIMELGKNVYSIQ